MRRLLPPELRRHFDTAWGIVPWLLRDRLKTYIQTVRCVPSLRGVAVKRRHGPPLIFEQEGDALFVEDDSAQQGHILLANLLESKVEADAVLTILHELAHASFYLDQNWRACLHEDAPVEVSAWLQAASWMACSQRADAKLLTDRAVQYARISGLNFLGTTLGELAAWYPLVDQGNEGEPHD